MTGTGITLEVAEISKNYVLDAVAGEVKGAHLGNSILVLPRRRGENCRTQETWVRDPSTKAGHTHTHNKERRHLRCPSIESHILGADVAETEKLRVRVAILARDLKCCTFTPASQSVLIHYSLLTLITNSLQKQTP